MLFFWPLGDSGAAQTSLAHGEMYGRWSRRVTVKKPVIPLGYRVCVMVLCQACGKPNMDDARFCFSCGTALSQAPPVKVEVKSPLGGFPATPGVTVAPAFPSIYGPRQVARGGSCYYHPELPSTFICSRCGRSICVNCTRQYGMLTFCTECFYGLASRLGYGPYPFAYEQQEQRRSLF